MDGGKGEGNATASPPAPYTRDEKDWLKRHWDGEFNFLVAHGLRIYEDRDEGRRVVRAMMETDEEEDGATDMLNKGASGPPTERSVRVLGRLPGSSSHGDLGDDEDEIDEQPPPFMSHLAVFTTSQTRS